MQKEQRKLAAKKSGKKTDLEKKMLTVEQASTAKINADGSREFNLEDGRLVKIIQGKGYHVEEAMKIINGDQSKYMSAMMAQVLTIDNSPVLMEDLREYGAKDYLKIMMEFSASGNL